MKKAITVAIVDDQPGLRRALRRILEKDGRFAIVGEAADGREAIAVVATTQPDAVILDLAMPIVDGMQAIPQLKKVSPRTKVVVFTSMASVNGIRAKALRFGAALVLSKSVSPRNLKTALVGAVFSP